MKVAAPGVVAFIAVCALLVAPGGAMARLVPYDPSTMSYPVTLSQAQQAARDWIGNQALQFTTRGVAIPPTSAQVQPNTDYVFVTSDGSQRIRVNCYSGVVTDWTDVQLRQAYTAKLPYGDDPTSRLPISELRATGEQFLAGKYPDWASMNMQQPDPSLPGNPYFQRLSNGVWHIRNSAGVGVDDWTGQVFWYGACTGPAPSISYQYSVTSAAAEQAALAYAQAGVPDEPLPQACFVLKNLGVWIDIHDDDSEHLVWKVDVVVSQNSSLTLAQYQAFPQAGVGNPITVYVDANTGVVTGATPGELDQMPYEVESAATPVFSPVAGSYSGAQTVTITCATSGSTIRYTTDGSTPTTSSPIYTAPISIASSQVLNARAWNTETRCSVVGLASYTIQ